MQILFTYIINLSINFLSNNPRNTKLPSPPNNINNPHPNRNSSKIIKPNIKISQKNRNETQIKLYKNTINFTFLHSDLDNQRNSILLSNFINNTLRHFKSILDNQRFFNFLGHRIFNFNNSWRNWSKRRIDHLFTNSLIPIALNNSNLSPNKNLDDNNRIHSKYCWYKIKVN